MKPTQFELTDSQKEKLRKGLKAALSIPLIDSLEDFIWEAIFCYTKDLPLKDPLKGIRSKLLFDVVDSIHKIGWSAKAVQWIIRERGEFELVIQRADVFKKGLDLGFEGLNIHSSSQNIGKALIKHWQMKVLGDAETQGIIDKRVCILMKSPNKSDYAFIEESLALYDADELEWKWTDATKTGFQGIRQSDNFCVYRWYPIQKQFFERFKYNQTNFRFSITPQRVDFDELIDWLNNRLEGKP